MALILNIDTSTKSTSVALAKDGKLIACLEEHEVVSHATKLSPFVTELLKDVKLKLEDLDAIAISIGPGSYTGLRIGLSTAKGLCYALDIPIISISALEAMAYKLKKTHTKNNKLFVSIMNSRKDEVYLCSIDNNLNIIHKPTAITVDDSFLREFDDILIGGTGLEKIKEKTNKLNITYIEDLNFSATNMVEISNKLFLENEFGDLAYIEPEYLKPFMSNIIKH